MTVIAARKYETFIEIAADSIACCDHRIIGNKTNGQPKLFRQNGLIIGSTGVSSECSLMQIFSRNHKPIAATVDSVIDFFVEFEDWQKKRDSDFKIDNQYLLIFENEIFRTYNRLEVFLIPEFDAIGAGGEFAIAAMHLDKSPKEAVKVACELSVWCNEPITGFINPIENAT